LFFIYINNGLGWTYIFHSTRKTGRALSDDISSEMTGKAYVVKIKPWEKGGGGGGEGSWCKEAK
jgi:hypothetical protein